MKKQITHVSPLQTAKVLAVMYFTISLPFVIFIAISIAASPEHQRLPTGFLIGLPFMYLIFGFLSTAFGAWVYNKVAGWIGGIEFTTEEKP